MPSVVEAGLRPRPRRFALPASRRRSLVPQGSAISQASAPGPRRGWQTMAAPSPPAAANASSVARLSGTDESSPFSRDGVRVVLRKGASSLVPQRIDYFVGFSPCRANLPAGFSPNPTASGFQSSKGIRGRGLVSPGNQRLPAASPPYRRPYGGAGW